eukprot:Phypoly_transcript_03862.p1 GENE.Phypoly_transcript_03862~~Phypoly_transcript_03862.p1  ORF type:complete len:706 (+),score=71.51 Phypoly_transcript_03862:131-2248(+)
MYFTLLLALSLLPFALTQEQFVLNLTAYDSFFTTNCLPSSSSTFATTCAFTNDPALCSLTTSPYPETCSLTPNPSLCSFLYTSPYPATCNPFSQPSLWIPNGLPGSNSTVNVSSDLPITVVIPNTETQALAKLSLVGVILFVVEGSLNFTFSDSVNSLVVCDTSSVLVRDNGILYVHLAAFFDNSTLVALNSSSITIDVVSSIGPFVSFSFFGDSVIDLGNVKALVYSVTARDNALLMSALHLQVQYFLLTDTARVTTEVYVYTSSVVDGQSYHLKAIYAYNSSSVNIRGCPQIDFISATDTAIVTLLTTDSTSPCTVTSLYLDTAATINVRSDIDVTILNLNPGFPYENATLSFDQFTPGQTTNIVLPRTTGPTFLEFNGNYFVVAGEADFEFHVPKPLTIYNIAVNGTVNLQVVEIKVGSGFQFVPGLTVTLPANGTLFVTSTFQLAQSQFIWEPYGIVEVDDHGSVVADSFELTDGRMLVLRNNYDDVPAAKINNLLIGKGCTLRAKGYHNSFEGSMQLDGELLVEPSGGSGYANMTISGNLSMSSSATLSLPQTLAFDILFPSSWTFLTVLGEVNLGGRLIVALGGQFPLGYTSANYTRADIAVMGTSNRISKTFNSFGGYLTKSLQAYANGNVALSYRISNDTVYLHLEKPKKNQHTLWFVLGVVGGILLIAMVLGFAIMYLRRKSTYKKIQDSGALNTF